MGLFALSLRSYSRSLRGALGLSRAALSAVALTVAVLCLLATGLGVWSVLQLDLDQVAPAALGGLRNDFARTLVLVCVLSGVFVAATTSPGSALRLVIRQTGGSRRDLYLLTAAVRDILCVIVPLLLAAVTYVPFAVLSREGVGVLAGVLLACSVAVCVTLMTAGAVELVKLAVLSSRGGIAEGVATASGSGLVVALALVVSPISLLPWSSPVAWSLLDDSGRLDARHATGLMALLLVTLGVWAAGHATSLWAERVRPVLRQPSAFAVTGVRGSGPVTVLVSLFVASISRTPVVLLFVVGSWLCAGLAHVSDSDLTAAIILTASSGLAGSVGLRAHGADLAARWWVLSLAPSSRLVAILLAVAALVVALTALVPTVASALVIFGWQAAIYFTITCLTTFAFTTFAGTLVPVLADEPLSTIAAGAVSFALSGGAVGAVKALLVDRSETAAAATATLAAIVALAASVALAQHRYRGSALS